MQLKRLEAYGFKSFADKITIEFDKGITAIVGPNGSGKSNITDAIRWVLGEKNIRNLRGAKSEDIIFAGSQTRRALGVAEVSLIFANDGTLPVDFREVSVTRRLYRSGESEFFINKARCRLKDIYNLFADTGIGHDGMSIIGQNRLDDILNSRPEERRAFFEETAGITKYRMRKRESVRKLTDTENNLIRVQDIIQEIANQLEPMARHAEKTRQYNELNTQYRLGKLTILSQNYEQEMAKKQASDEALQSQRDAVAAAETKIKTMSAERETLAKDIIDLERSMQDRARKNEATRNQLEQVVTQMATLQERQEQSTSRQQRLAEQRTALTGEITVKITNLAQLMDKEQTQKQKATLAADLLAKEKTKANSLAEKITAQKATLELVTSQKEAQQQKLTSTEQELALIERDLNNFSQSSENQARELTKAKQQQQQLSEQQTALTAKLTGQNDLIAKCQQQRDVLKGQLKQLTATLSQATADSNKLEKKLNGETSRLQLLEQLQQEYDGFGKAVKAVLKSQEPWRKGVAGAVAELITVPPAYATAIEIALSGNAQNIVTVDTETAKSAINFLKREKKGRVTFMPLATIVPRQPDNKSVLAEPGVIGWANELVQVDESYQKIVDFLLSRTLVVDTLDNALELAKKQNYRLRMVTLEGEYFSPGGTIAGGSGRNKEAGFISRAQEITSLSEKVASHQQQLAKLTAKVAAVKAEQQTAEANLQAADEDLPALKVAQAELKGEAARLNEKIASQQQLVAEFVEKSQQSEANKLALTERKQQLSTELAAIKLTYEDSSQAVIKNKQLTADLEADATQLANYIHERELMHTVLEQEILRTHEHYLLEKQAKDQLEQTLLANEAENKQLVAELASSQEKLAELTSQNTKLADDYELGKAQHNDIYSERMDKLTANQKIDKQLQENNRKLNKLQDKLHKLELSATKLKLSLNDIVEEMLSEYGLTPDRAAEEALPITRPELIKQQTALEKALEELGPVNPNALAEYEKLNERYTFMQKQATDLVQAKTDLEALLAEMDTAMTKQFKEAFAKIQIYFGEIFVRLFGGGKAELKLLDEDDVLNTGIDILITLPQKKRQTLAALSGGERALTVIALLFAFLKYRPSPFAVLDEIDAPLDEANVVRFGNFLKEFADSTQFIVVTHRKGTMEAVDTMYGVTVEAAGVSRLLSVKLDEIQA